VPTAQRARGGRPTDHPYHNICTPSILLARTSKVDPNPALKVLSVYRPISVKSAVRGRESTKYMTIKLRRTPRNPSPGVPQKSLLEHPGEDCAGETFGVGDRSAILPITLPPPLTWSKKATVWITFQGVYPVITFSFSHRQGSSTSLEPSTATRDFTTDQNLACAKRLMGLSCHSQQFFSALTHKS
jgi:hypothetical protein